jgi:FkbM family methyltransferase
MFQSKNLISTARLVKKSLQRDGVPATMQKIKKHLYWKSVTLFKPRFVRSVYGPKFRLQADDNTFWFYIRGDYGHYFSEFLKQFHQPFVFIDIGANQGLYSIIAAQNKNCKKAWAFEPVAHTFALLQQNIAANQQSNKIHAIQAAISQESGKKNISVNPTHTGGASLNQAVKNGIEEAVDCMDSIALATAIQHEADLPIIIKIDTEGHEPLVLEELTKTPFWNRVSFLFFEVDTRWFDGNAIVEKLKPLGFAEVWRTGDALIHYDVMMERTARIAGSNS